MLQRHRRASKGVKNTMHKALLILNDVVSMEEAATEKSVMG